MRLIDLDAAIDAITRIKIKDVYDEKHAKGITVGLLSAIDELERLPAVNRWIPVTERLPEEGGEYLVTWKYWDTLHIELAYFGKMSPRKKGKPCFYTSDSEYGDVPMPKNSVTAWMPLPEPYEEESE